jgi:glycerate 2-kinase
MPVPDRPVLVAPDAFAGRLRATQVAAAIGRGLERAGLRAPDLCPVSGGGAGTLEVLLTSLGGETAAARLHDGTDVGFGLIEDGATAVVEPAANGYGTGELLCAAAAAGAQVLLLCAADGPPSGGAAEAIADHGGLGGARVVVLAGADTAGWDGLPGQAVRGSSFVLDALDFDERMRAARAVVTGEGRLDQGALEGRPLGEIGTRTRQAGVPLHALVAADALDAFGKRMIDLQVVREAATPEELEAAGEELGLALAEGRA